MKPMVVHDLYTEDQRTLVDLVKKYVDNFTLIKSTGVYKEESEHSVIIRIISSFQQDFVIEQLVLDIKDKYKQECILHLKYNVGGKML